MRRRGHNGLLAEQKAAERPWREGRCRASVFRLEPLVLLAAVAVAWSQAACYGDGGPSKADAVTDGDGGNAGGEVAEPATEGDAGLEQAADAAFTIQGLSGVTALSASQLRTCVVLEDGRVACWGGADNFSDQGIDERLLVAEVVEEVADAMQVATGDEHACALLAGGKVTCWGSGALFGIEVAGSQTAPVAPTEVEGVSEAIAVTSGLGHVCALLHEGTVSCWGYNSRGQLGNGGFVHSAKPVAVEGLTDAVAIAAGMDDTCALRQGGRIACWGSNYLPSDEYASSAPFEMAGLPEVEAIAVGSDHACAATAAGNVLCWGRNSLAQCGYPATAIESNEPIEVNGVEGATALALGSGHSCALLFDGRVMCWGANDEAQLGIDRRTQPRSTPIAVSGLEGVDRLTAGANHTCALMQDRTVRCWGSNYSGQLGTGDTKTGLVPTPVRIGGV